MSETVEAKEVKFKVGSAEYELDVIKRARKAAVAIGKTLENYKLMGEALSIMRKRAMKSAGLTGQNKQPSGPKYTKALNEELDKAPEFLDQSVFESGSARTHAIWLHECAADVEWTFTITERTKPGSTKRWNNPTYIWKQWRRLTKEPTKAALAAKAAKERKAEEMAREVEDYREHWKRKYEEVQAKLEALEFSGPAFQHSTYPAQATEAPKRKRGSKWPKEKPIRNVPSLNKYVGEATELPPAAGGAGQGEEPKGATGGPMPKRKLHDLAEQVEKLGADSLLPPS
jgi:hypothetical protein